MKIAIIGGGRWARTIASVLAAAPARDDSVVLHSASAAPALAAWIDTRQLGHRLRAVPHPPGFTPSLDRPDAVIVTNRAADHFSAASIALSAGVPTLVEKPMSWPSDRIVKLQELAEAHGALLAASNVVLFSRYLDAFAGLVGQRGPSGRLDLVWADGKSDIVRGETKAYDPGTTVFDDILPHIVSIAGALRYRDLSLASVSVQRGGAEVALAFRSEGREVHLNLARDGAGRRRLIEIDTPAGRASLDFSVEPGVIRADGEERNGDPQWDTAPRPLATMLAAFLAAVEGAPLDARLSPAHALAAAKVADDVRGRYLAHQIAWLGDQLGRPMDEAIAYAVNELAGNKQTAITATEWSKSDGLAHLNALIARSPLLAAAGYAR